MTTDALLDVRDAHVRYGGLHALWGVSLVVPRGSCVLVLGPNGAGKSSLMRAVTGIVPLAQGDVLFKGSSIRRLRPERRVDLGVAMVPEGRRIFTELTALENLQLAQAAGRTKDFEAALEEIFAIFPQLQVRIRNRANTLSGGEQQMLAIARAMLTSPELLILDEPSIGLAPKLVHEVYERLAHIRSRGITLLVVEQNTVALDIATVVHILRNGRIVSSGAPSSYAQVDQLATAYLGENVG